MEYLATLNTPAHYVVKGAGGIYTGFSWHAVNIAYSNEVETQKNKGVPLISLLRKVW
jgi:hypothetical protein